MSGVTPVAVYALRVPANGALIPAVPEFSAMFRVSMAAIDPDEAPEYEDGFDSNKRPRATLKLVRAPPGLDLEGEDDDDEDWEDDEDEDSEDDEEVNGGPSDKEKARKLKLAAARKELEDAMDEDDDEDEDDEEGEFDLKAAISKLIKGKAPANDDEESDAESDEGLELDETVICTLDPEKNCQQPLDIVVNEEEPVFFKVTGTHTIYLTGNYVMPTDDHHHDHDGEESDEEDYDLSPDEDELDMEDLIGEDDESDDLDDLENPRITEVDSEEEEAPKLVESKQTKGKGKRAAEPEEAKPEPALSKKQQKKLKKNNGEAAPVEEKKEAKEGKEAKKVQFAKNLEQGPTGSTQQKPAEKSTGTLGVKEVKGVKIDDKKLGQGVAAKAGNTVAMRYIGKLEDGKVFDANKKGKPFTFKLGKGEVIKGWDIGVAGMAVGGERRISIPPHLAYGKRALPGIPANSKLIFDATVELSGSASTISADAEYQVAQHKSNGIRDRIKQRSSRILSLLGLRGPSGGRAVDFVLKTVTTRETTAPQKPSSESNPSQSFHSLPADIRAPSSSTAMEEEEGREGLLTCITHSCTTPLPETLMTSATPREAVSPEQSGNTARARKSEMPELQSGSVAAVKRSKSTPAVLTSMVSTKLSTTFGNPTVIRRSHLRSPLNIMPVHYPASSPGPSRLVESPNDSSSPSTSPISSVSPLGTQSTPPTSEDPSRGSKQALGGPVKALLHSSPSPHSVEEALSSTEVSGTSPSIVTVEAAANAKVFFETYFNNVFCGTDPRSQRRQELEQYMYGLPLSPEERARIWDNWITQERHYLRQCRVLKSRSHGGGSHDTTVSLAGFEVIKVLGRGSFGVVRLVKEEKTEDTNHDGDSEDKLLRWRNEGTNSRAYGLDSLRSANDGTKSSRRRIMTGVKKDVFAMKVIRKSAMIRNSQEGHLRAERDFLVASAKSRWINHLYLIMDYMVGGDFLGLLMRRNMLPETVARWYIAEMILCIEEAHRLCWIHRDVKPDNFLISASGHLKISDFGLAFDGHWAHDQVYYNDHRHTLLKRLGIRVDGDDLDQTEAKRMAESSSGLDPGPVDDSGWTPPTAGLLGWRDRTQKRRLAGSIVGTNQYMAPEVVRGELYDGRCDWWSIGIILYECLYGFTPFASDDRQKTKLKIHHHLQTLHFPNRPSDKLVSAEAIDLINNLLQEKEHRLSSNKYRVNDSVTFRLAAKHPLYSMDPRNKNYRGFYVYPNDATDIKSHPFFCCINWNEIHQSMPPFIPKVKGWEDTRYFDDAGYEHGHDEASAASDAEHAEPSSEADERDERHQNRGDPPQYQDIGSLLSPVASKPPQKNRRKGRDKKRPRDKLLRDRKLRMTTAGEDY
ncbi:kinase-like protein [Aspergillus neoniger CBS 115656]|uniref:peptidylprolyl isomerase n=1 Tax=Aspergillus neoniger (strain CBS 115656) TaxID=1448310 RepID=A0A318YSZ3_ASPNB|nr:kinase-like protein [Aspergillus neoniger CBS 115656]PYH37444.1 kinase-like protein [Aspergillus neoniger CBS 115656]